MRAITIVMFKKNAFLLILTLCMCFPLACVEGHNDSYIVHVFPGARPLVDGQLAFGEWSDAAILSFNQTCVCLKHDANSIYVAFNVTDATLDSDKEGVALGLDVSNDGGSSFNVSDDVVIGAYRNGTAIESNSTSILPPSPGWNVATFEESWGYTAEFNITNARVGLASYENKTLGLMLNSYDWNVTSNYFWPPTISASRLFIPSDWGDMTVELASGTIYIRADGSIDPPDAPISTFDYVTYTFTGNITSDADGIVVERSNITIDGNGLTLEGNGDFFDTSSIGILLSDLDNVTVRNISISGFGIGVSIYTTASNNIVSGNSITNSSRAGIDVSFNPKILANPNWFLYTPKYNNISANYLANNDLGIYVWRTSDNTIYGNNIVNSNISGIYLESPSNTTIVRNNVTNSHDGIFFWGVPYNNTVYGNTIVNGTYGLYCGSVNSVLRNNTMVNNRYNFVSEGIVNDVDTSNTVDGKPIYYWVNKQDMIIPLDAGHVTLVNCTGITAHNLNLTNNSPGILLWSTKNSAVTLCNISNNYGGILLQGSSNYDSIVGNNIENNEYAGIELEGSSGNSLFYNNIINNTNETVTLASWGNTWDNGYPSGGNYWSNHTNIDLYGGLYQNTTGSDGIGDTPYSIDANNQDNYPLTARFSDFNITSEYCVQTICNSSITDFQFNGTAISFNVSGENDTTGFCRICIPTALMSTTYKVFVNGTEILYNLLPCSNETYSYLYFNYTHSIQEVIIIPEFPSILILPLFMIATLLAVITYKRKKNK